MLAFIPFLNDVWRWIAENSGGGSILFWGVTLALFLTGSAMILAWTRFGQRQPVWTCAALSVVAHLLLVAMASNILLTQKFVGHDNGNVASINVVEFDETSPDGRTAEGSDESPEIASDRKSDWEKFTTSVPVPDLPELARPEIDSDITFGKTPMDLPPLVASIARPDAMESSERNFDLVGSLENAFRLPDSLVQPDSEIELPEIPPTPTTPQKMAAVESLDPLNDASEVPDYESVRTDDAANREIGSLIAAAREANANAPQTDFPPTPVPVPAELPIADPIRLPNPMQQVSSAVDALRTAKRRPADNQPLPVEYSLRASPDRMQIVAGRGGSADTEQAVRLGLQWLANHQSADGRWNPRETGAGVENLVLGQDRQGAGSNADTGITGLALLAFLSGGHTHLEGEYQATVQRGLNFLQSIQSPDGSLFGNARLYERMYCHSMAMLAIGEAVAMTGDEQLKENLRLAVDYSVRAQSRFDGGWRYQPGDQGDLSQFGWVVLGLRSAELAGVTIPVNTKEGMYRFLHSCTQGRWRGLASYRPVEGPSPTMTAEGLVCRYLLEKTPDPNSVNEAVAYLNQSLPDETRINYYYWYYGTMAMYQVGGDPWRQWNDRLTRVLVARQIQSGDDRGSWPTDGMWSGYGGKAYTTALSTLCLEVYYRYMPVYESLRAPDLKSASGGPSAPPIR